MDKLRVTPEQLLKLANNLKSKGEEVFKDVQSMTKVSDSFTGAVWSGEASNAYKKQMDELNDDVKRMKDLFQKIYEALQKISKEYADAEKDNQQLANKLTDDIF